MLPTSTSHEKIANAEMDPVQQQQQPVRERQTIWQGVLEWIEKPKDPNNPQKLTRQLPCQVSTYTKEGEPDLKANSWPQKLILQFIPKQLIGNIGGIYLKNSKYVLFHPLNCEALESLTKLISSGFVGCVHFISMSPTSACDIKVLILLYTSEKRAYLGYIPNDQTTFVDRLRRVIQQSKSSQALIKQGQIDDSVLSDTDFAASPTNNAEEITDDNYGEHLHIERNENVEQDVQQSQNSIVDVTPRTFMNSEDGATPRSSSKKRKTECYVNAVEAIAQSLNQTTNNEIDTFVRFIGSELNHFKSVEHLRTVKQKIIKVIYEELDKQ